MATTEQMSMFGKDGAAKGGGGGKRGGGGGGGGQPPNQAPIDAWLDEEARRRYLNYALSVITSRALPDVRDGLKPVQRRILYGMSHDLRLSNDAKYMKCAKVTGLVMGQYHPHGNSAIYEALARMAQDWSLRYPLIDGHGNFGSLDGDSPAAERYTECRMAGIASEMLNELNKDTVDFRPTYDGSDREPVVVPSRLPHMLMNGATGIAVGMATNIPPHNLTELCEALHELSKNRQLEIKDLLKYVKGPDFPTGGQILNSKAEIRDIYETGSGSIRVRGEWKLEEMPRGGKQIIITSIPFMINKGVLVTKLGEVVIERKLPALVDVRDESTTDVRIVLELKKDANPDLVLAYLYKHTSLQTSFGVNLTCLEPTANPEIGAPRRLNLKEILEHFLDFRFDVVKRRLEYELREIQKRLHILEGFEKVYDALDEMIRIIRKSDGKEDAATKLIKRFELSDEQTDAILEMKLYRLARLEILVIEKDLKEKRAEQKRLKGLLESKRSLEAVVREELAEIQKQYGDKRRTKIGGAGAEELEYSEEAFIADEDAHVILTRDGWLKRVREIKDPTQTRVREGDEVAFVLAGSLKSNVVFFTNFGTAYVTRFNDIPPSTGYGDPIQKLFKFDDNERVVGATSLDPRIVREEKLLAISRKGYGLRFALAAHTELSTRAGRRFAKPAEGDELIGVSFVQDKDLLAVVTEESHTLVCKVEEVNELAGPGRGVTVIKVDDDDKVIAYLATSDKQAVVALETTKGKKLELTTFRQEPVARGGKGWQMVKRDRVLRIPTGPVVQVLPAAPEKK